MRTIIGPLSQYSCRRTVTVLVLATLVGSARQTKLPRLDYGRARKLRTRFTHLARLRNRELSLVQRWMPPRFVTKRSWASSIAPFCSKSMPEAIDLAEALHTQLFDFLSWPPTARHGTLEGYSDATDCTTSCKRVGRRRQPGVMTQDYQEAPAIQASDSARAIALLKSIVEDGKGTKVRPAVAWNWSTGLAKLQACQKESQGKAADEIVGWNWCELMPALRDEGGNYWER